MRYQLDLYDLCIAIDGDNFSNHASIADRLRITGRTLERRIKRLKEQGIKVNVEEYLDDEREVRVYYLEEHIDVVLNKLDKISGLWPFSKESNLTAEEKEKVLEVYLKILKSKNGYNAWPPSFFADKKNRADRLRVIVPYVVENILKKEPEDVTKKDIKKVKLGEALRYYHTPFKLLKVAYSWLE